MENILLDVYDVSGKKIKMPFNEVLKNEVGKLGIGQYHIEIVKLLVVLKRSELMKNVKNSPYALKYERKVTLDKNIILSDEENAIINDAIAATKESIVINGDKTVDLYFTKCCGGGTANSEDILGYRINYLRKILCKLCDTTPKDQVIKISEIAEKQGLTNGSIKEEIKGILSNVVRDETGRIINISVMGNSMTGEEFSNLFACNSARVYFQENSIMLRSIGEGSGLGICLAGANALAHSGLNFIDIIKYYYTGVEVLEYDEMSLLSSLRGKKIIIDPGHGGSDIGNSIGDILEKDVNLDIALELQKKLSGVGMEVILTRTSDMNMPSTNRVNSINGLRPEFFISIHQNKFVFPSTNGVEVYCYEMDAEAIKLGEYIGSFISEDLKTKNRGVKVGDYHLLRETKVSGLILECMYMSGDSDSEKYKDSNYELLANSIFKGICKFYGI